MSTRSFVLVGLLFLAPALRAEPASVAVRAGWAYGAGGELELRPGSWGGSVSGGYVPGLGAGGYLSATWGSAPLDSAGFVAEAGLFRGVRNPLRTAPTGLGVHLLAGYAFAPASRVSVRFVAGGGLPFADLGRETSFEFLAKLTAGFVF